MKYQEWLNGCGCCPDIQDCTPSTGIPCDCDSILLELSKQHTDDLVLQEEIDNLDEKKLDASAYTPVDLTDYYTKEEVDELIPSLDGYATEEWVNEQGFLKTVEPLKTINGESLIGEGDIVISGGSANVPVYSGSAFASVSINNPSGLANSYNRINGRTSVGAGYMVETRNVDEAAFGFYNLSNCEDSEVFNYNSGNTLFSVGNGHPHNTGGDIRKHNAFEIRQNGDIYYADTNDTEAENPYEMPMIKLQDVIKNLQNEINTLKTQINGN